MAIKNVMLIEMSAENEDDSSKQYAADIYLPASLYEIDDAVERCRGYLVKTDMMPLIISECERVPLLSQLRFDTVTIYELNYLAKQISEFSNTQLAVYNALLPLVVGENFEGELISIKDVINLTYCVDDYSVASNIFNDTDLGEMLIDNGMVEGIENLSDEMIEFLDTEKVGEAHRMSENGIYVNGCYISREGFKGRSLQKLRYYCKKVLWIQCISHRFKKSNYPNCLACAKISPERFAKILNQQNSEE
ncbi:MAG: antirestriction protein ArdA [Clostridiales bacterium]|nr:antirestriction protein ArdA [Clostridiales bacterium]